MAESVVDEWYRALRAWNCPKLERLLEARSSLVLEGWKVNNKRTKDGELVTASITTYWTGRTALHAAARRGSLELMTAIVDLFGRSHEGEWLLEDVGSDEYADPLTLADLLAEKDGEWRLEPLAIAAVYGYQDLVKALMETSLKCTSNPYEIRGQSLEHKMVAQEQERKTVAQIGRMAEEVMARLTANERSTIETQHSRDTAFHNFRLEEYLLLYAFSSTSLDARLSKRLRKEISKRMDYTSDLHDFLRHKAYRQRRADEASTTVSVVNEIESGQRTVDEVSTSVSVVNEEVGAGTEALGVSNGLDIRADEVSTSVSVVNQGEGAGTEAEGVSNRTDIREQARNVTKECMASLSMDEIIKLQFAYSEDEEFSLLDIEEFLFLFFFSFRNVYREFCADAKKVRQDMWRKVEGSPNSQQLKRFFLFELRDDRGRSALHVAAESGKDMVRAFLSLVPEGKEYADWVNPRDRVGRTPLYMAAASGRVEELRALMNDDRVDLEAKLDKHYHECSSERGYWEDSVSKRNGFDSGTLTLTALQIAILCKQHKSVQALLQDENKHRRKECLLDCTCNYPIEYMGITYAVQPLALAVWAGAVTIVELLLKDGRVTDTGRPSKFWVQQKYTSASEGIHRHFPGLRLAAALGIHTHFPALHFAAALGRFDMVKVFLDTKGIDRLYDPFVRDASGNTAMHHVTQGTHGSFPYYLLHLVDPSQVLALGLATNQSRNLVKDERKGFIERQGCVGLLLQVGLEVWTLNSQDQAPYPKQTSPEFLSWWYEKLAQETLEEQNTLNAAANAISITAALVAATSYVGPLQPPLSYESNAQGRPSQIQVENVWVRMFIACNTLSFYLAVGSIMLAIIPSLPIPQQRMRMELKYTRRVVTFAVGFLFPSIISVLLAFAASSTAVIPDCCHGGLNLSMSVVGGLLCVLVICIFSIRILGLVMHRNKKIKALYGDTIFINETISRKWKEFSVGKAFERGKLCKD